MNCQIFVSYETLFAVSKITQRRSINRQCGRGIERLQQHIEKKEIPYTEALEPWRFPSCSTPIFVEIWRDMWKIWRNMPLPSVDDFIILGIIPQAFLIFTMAFSFLVLLTILFILYLLDGLSFLLSLHTNAKCLVLLANSGHLFQGKVNHNLPPIHFSPHGFSAGCFTRLFFPLMFNHWSSTLAK